jgi:DNA replication protein DnaC
MKTADPADAARVELFLADLRLPAIKQVWATLAEQSDKEGWPAARFLAALAEHEIADRGRRRIERHLAEARLPVGKTLDSFDFDAVPMVSKAQVMALTAGDSWLEKGANLLLFGPPGGGKSHLAAAIGLALVENSWRVLFTRTSDLVQRLQIARRELALESAIAKLDKYHLLILDDVAYVSKDQAETSVLFELIGSRYERRSMLITSNQSFGEWGKVFPDQAMTLAAIDRLVHHATILERMSRAIGVVPRSTANVVPVDRQRTRQSRRRVDCRSATITKRQSTAARACSTAAAPEHRSPRARWSGIRTTPQARGPVHAAAESARRRAARWNCPWSWRTARAQHRARNQARCSRFSLPRHIPDCSRGSRILGGLEAIERVAR